MAEKPEENNSKKQTKQSMIKRRFHAKKIGAFIKRYGTSVYMILAFCLVAAVTISVLTINMNYSDIEEEIEIPEIKIPTLPDYNEIVPTEKSVDSIQTGVDGRIDETTRADRPAETVKQTSEFVYPITSGKVIKKYSADALVFSATLNDYRVHSGIDIQAEIGTPVLAYSGGTVSAIEDLAMMGKSVTVTHQFGLTSVYMNLDEELPAGIQVGATVKAGDKIGKVGKTAIAEIGEKPHLHFEIKLNGANIDPQKELEAIK